MQKNLQDFLELVQLYNDDISPIEIFITNKHFMN